MRPKWLDFAFLAVKVIAAVGVGLSQFGFLANDSSSLLWRIFFFVLLIGVGGIDDVYNTLERERRRQRFANSVLTQALELACEKISKGTPYRLKANIMFPTGLINRRLEARFQYPPAKKRKSPTPKFEKGQGCVGHAWFANDLVVADLTLPEVHGGARWNLTNEQRELTKELKAIMSVPIRYPTEDNERPGRTLGFLNFDSEQPCAEHFSKEEIRELVTDISDQIARTLRELGII